MLKQAVAILALLIISTSVFAQELKIDFENENKEELKYKGFLVELKTPPVLDITDDYEHKLDIADEQEDELREKKEEELTQKKLQILEAALVVLEKHADEVKDEELEQISKQLATIEEEHKNFEDALKDIGLAPGITGSATHEQGEVEEFKIAFNGYYLENLAEEKVAAVEELPNVKRVVPNYEKRLLLDDSTHIDGTQLIGVTKLMGARQVWETLKDEQGRAITGKDIRIGIIDTGVDHTQPSIAPNYAGGYDFGDNDNDPGDDIVGHGTHVAGTAAGRGLADGKLKGVAPEAKIIAYKVASSDGMMWGNAIMAAIERSFDLNGNGAPNENKQDRLDIISLSLGGGGDADSPDSQAIDRATANGVVAVIAAGNSGPNSLTIGSPGAARTAITVGASDDGDRVVQFSSRGPTLQCIKYVELCKPKPEYSDVQCMTIQDAGRDIICNMNPSACFEVCQKLEVDSTCLEENRRLCRRNPTVLCNTNSEVCLTKPDVVAPGTHTENFASQTICAAKSKFEDLTATCQRLCSGPWSNVQDCMTVCPPEFLCGGDDKHIRKQGTSMSTPAVSGVVALILQANPNLNPAEVKEILKQTAKNLGKDANIQGAGRVDALAAVQEAVRRRGGTTSCTPKTEICGNGIDEDCNGADLACQPTGGEGTTTQAGVTEITIPLNTIPHGQTGQPNKYAYINLDTQTHIKTDTGGSNAPNKWHLAITHNTQTNNIQSWANTENPDTTTLTNPTYDFSTITTNNCNTDQTHHTGWTTHPTPPKTNCYKTNTNTGKIQIEKTNTNIIIKTTTNFETTEPQPTAVPDFAIGTVNAPTTAKTGETITVTSTVSNDGDAAGTVSVGLDAGGPSDPAGTINALAPTNLDKKATTTSTRQLSVAFKYTQAGTYTMKFTAYDGSGKETNKANNEKTATITVTTPPSLCVVTESKETSCNDGKDNDCDGQIDSQDNDCQTTEPEPTPTGITEITIPLNTIPHGQTGQPNKYAYINLDTQTHIKTDTGGSNAPNKWHLAITHNTQTNNIQSWANTENPDTTTLTNPTYDFSTITTNNCNTDQTHHTGWTTHPTPPKTNCYKTNTNTGKIQIEKTNTNIIIKTTTNFDTSTPTECTAGATRACNTGEQGVCSAGTQTCQSTGQWGTCARTTGPTTETCDGQDNDCDNEIDEGVKSTFYRDADGDGYGSQTATQACTQPAGHATNNQDCDDTKPTVKPGATDQCGNGIDEDCNGQDLACTTTPPRRTGPGIPPTEETVYNTLLELPDAIYTDNSQGIYVSIDLDTPRTFISGADAQYTLGDAEIVSLLAYGYTTYPEWYYFYPESTYLDAFAEISEPTGSYNDITKNICQNAHNTGQYKKGGLYFKLNTAKCFRNPAGKFGKFEIFKDSATGKTKLRMLAWK